MARTQQHWEIVNRGNIVVPQTPPDIWESACNYFLFCDTHPIIKTFKIKTGEKAGQDCTEELPRVYSYDGLAIHTGLDEDYIRDVLNNMDKSSEYYHVFSRIDKIIRTQQFELAAVNEINAIFISKSLRLEDTATPNTAIEVIVRGETPQLANSENEILEKLDYGIGDPEDIVDENSKEHL